MTDPKQPCTVVILGASGDLARRKLVPALDRLYLQGRINGDVTIVGSGRTPFTDAQFRDRFTVSDGFRDRMCYHQGLGGLRSFIEQRASGCRVVFFMALPPSAYAETARQLAAGGFGPESSLIIEKPFGCDLDSARRLNADIARYFTEDQVYRIDHYLAKEAVQNILVFRFANPVFYPTWNSRYIESIQINALEQIGVEDRGVYFDSAGIIRDMVQNHLAQLLCLLTMETPVSLDPADLRARKTDVLRTLSVEQCHRYQYDGYRREKGVAPHSTTETFAELKLRIDNFRWSGMPVYIRTGKAAGRKATEIGVTYKKLPRLLFNRDGGIEQNRIIFKIQPAEGVILDMSSKAVGTDSMVASTHMDFCFRDAFSGEIPEAYQRLLLDVFRQDHTLFVGARETEASWRVFGPVLDKGEIVPYAKGTVPTSRLDAPWIDFEHYRSFCE